MNIQDYITTHKERVESVLKSQLSQFSSPISLQQSMFYGVLNGGKRLRPILAYASAESITGHSHCADIPACALELIHSYSLIHDDLPAMDDDALRRGKPTCHIKFGEAEAILAGDALQTLAFEMLASSNLLSVGNSVRLKMITNLSRAAGGQGMVGGQSIDIGASGTIMKEDKLAEMHCLKTGALILASVSLGALSTGVARPEQLLCLEQYAQNIGLAFQVRDDILDVESDTKTLGKQQGQDLRLNKPTYTSMLGLEGAKTKAKELCEQSIACLDGFGKNSEALIALAKYIVRRSH